MYIPYKMMLMLSCVFALLTSCSGTPTPKPTPSNVEELKNQELSYGYGQLYKTVSGLKHVKKVLYVKIASDKVDAVIEDISAYAKHVADQLERLNQQYPSLYIDDSGLPTLERKRRSAIVWDQVFTMAPVVGKTGKAFERALLVTQVAVLNNLRFLAEVLQDAEKSDQRKAVLEQIRTRSNALYQRVIELLEQDYFC